jgi:hypothetical protein
MRSLPVRVPADRQAPVYKWPFTQATFEKCISQDYKFRRKRATQIASLF